jgi:hypothetical protein
VSLLHLPLSSSTGRAMRLGRWPATSEQTPKRSTALPGPLRPFPGLADLQPQRLAVLPHVPRNRGRPAAPLVGRLDRPRRRSTAVARGARECCATPSRRTEP